MIRPNEEVYQASRGKTPTCATRPTLSHNIRKVNPNMKGPPHSRTLKLRSKLSPPLVGTPHQTGRAKIEPPAPGPHETLPILTGVPQWGL